MMAAGTFHCGGLRPQLQRSSGRRPRHPAAANLPRAARRWAGMAAPQASSSGFAELKHDAEADYNKAKSLLPTLETALQTAAHAKGPAEDADAAWQFCHHKLTTLQERVHTSMAELRAAMVEVAGGEEAATFELVQHHLRARMARIYAQLEPQEWEEFEVTALPVPINGVQFLTQVAACRVGERFYAVACLALGGPFLSSSLQSLLLHWAAARKSGGRWEQPPAGWLTSPAISHAQGDRAWQTPFSYFAPQILGMAVQEAGVHSVMLQLPLEGPLEEPEGGLPFVLKRTDGGQPEWVKKHHHHDFQLDLSQAIAHFSKMREEAASMMASPRQDWFHAWGLDDWDWGRTTSPNKSAPAKDTSLGWLSQVSSWEEVHDHPRPTAPPSISLQRVRQVAKALAAHGAAGVPNNPDPRKGPAGGRALMRQCELLTQTLKELDAAELAATVAQKRKEQMHEVYVKAEATASQLKKEIVGSLDTARRATVRLRGRSTEITQGDLEMLAAQLAEEMSRQAEQEEEEAARRNRTPEPPKLGRQLVFLQESVMRVAGIDAQVLVQTYLDGPKQASVPPPTSSHNAHGGAEEWAAAAGQFVLPGKAVPPAAAAATNGSVVGLVDAAALVGDTPSVLDGVAGPAKPPPPPAFDSVLVSVVVGEDFPDATFKTPLVLHWAGCHHEGSSWLQPPEGWTASGNGSRREGAATQTPLQRYTITLDGGDPVLVDPSLYGACLRLPLKSCKASGTQGLEFVLKGRDGAWLVRQHAQGRTSNFFMELPRVA